MALRTSYHHVRRLIHVLQGHDLWQRTQIKCETVLLGNEGARWSMCPVGLSEKSVIYSFGVGEDVSFDLGLIQHFGMQIHAFDPTPRSVRWVQSQTLPENFIFHPYGVADHDGTSSFIPPQNPG